ncbi:MAG: outer membrane protein transport protein [Paracoccaceae bacterium]
MGMSKMGRVLVTASALALAAGAANAGGIDRSGQSIAPLFEKGGYAELSFGTVNPSVSGKDVAIFGGRNSQNVGEDYLSLGFAYKQDINDQLSYAIIYEKPFGADLSYASVASGGSVAFGGTKAHAGYDELSAILRYKFNDNMSAYGGLRISRASGDVTLRGAAYGPLSGYNANFSNDTGIGYVVGAAYEKPEIALRVALTYHSAIKHEHDTKETIGGFPIGPVSTTEVSTPQSVNLDVQSGVAPGWLAFGQIRWVDWSAYDIDPIVLTKQTNGGVFVKGGGLVDLNDSTTYTIGIGHKFNDQWSGAASVSYEEKGDPLVSPLAPTNGRLGVTLAAVYTTGNTKITTGINYTKLGDAKPETGTPDVARANFTGNSAVGVGVRVGFSF